MADTNKTSSDYEPGRVDENTHGWAPDAPGTGEAKERVIEANEKAREAQSSVGEDAETVLPPVAETDDSRRSGEDIARGSDEEGRHGLGTQGPTDRPVGTSTAEASTGVDPQDPIDEDMPNVQTP